MSKRSFEKSNDAEYRKGYYDGQHDAFAASELDAYYAGVGFGKREHGDKHMGFNNANERRQFEAGIRNRNNHFNAYRIQPKGFWERIFGGSDNAEKIDYTGRRAAKRQRKKQRKATRKVTRMAKRQNRRQNKRPRRSRRSD